MARYAEAGARRGCFRLDAKIARAEIVHTGPELVPVYARLRADCEARGHSLGSASLRTRPTRSW